MSVYYILRERRGMSIYSGQKGTACGAFLLFSFNLLQNSGKEEILALWKKRKLREVQGRAQVTPLLTGRAGTPQPELSHGAM